jgi:CDP-glycerol glycerophosphotransferase (TagB/SpsB family)
MKHYLFYIEQDYSFQILRPLQDAIRSRGDEVKWFVAGNDVNRDYLLADESELTLVSDVNKYNPIAVFAPGDRIPSFIPGLKVQVFHGLNEDKRGNIYPERGLFDLYCTEGPGRTDMLAPLEKERGYFRVCETGWLKLDAILNCVRSKTSNDRPRILYASTFTPRLSSAEALHQEIERLAQSSCWQWLVTLHPKIDPQTMIKYQALQNDNLTYHGTDEVVNLLHQADVMVSDNSSIFQEFLLLGKPVVTFRNRDPQSCMIDIQEPAQLKGAIESALNPSPQVLEAIRNYGTSITPYVDGRSSGRVLDAVDSMLDSGWQDRKPANFWRNWKIRRQLRYYRL